jgi:hypothetical protein
MSYAQVRQRGGTCLAVGFEVLRFLLRDAEGASEVGEK